ncbi:hypothetical protein ACFL6S_26715 [Candidatus Poribacteria bacterium]
MHIQLILIVSIMCQLASNAGASQITELKPLYAETPLIHSSGQAASVIVAPDDPELRRAARILSKQIQEMSGITLETLSVDNIVSEDWQMDFGRIDGKTLVALGNINNNRLLAVLYGEGYVVADSVYPGAGGYVVRTVHDPFANGVNVLVLAGSDTDGVRQAVEVFLEKYLSPASGGIRLKQPITDVKFTPVNLPFLPQPVKPEGAKRQPQYRTAQFYREQLTDENGQIKRIEKGNVLNVFWPITGMAQTYFWTGDPELPPLMKAFFDQNKHLLTQSLERVEMEGGTAEQSPWWDTIEELPVWTDQDRLDITNAFLRDSRLGHERRSVHRLVKEGYTQVIDENHGTFAAMRDYLAWHYFDKYYDLPETQYWMDVARAMFAGQVSTHQILEDAAGYMCYIPDTTMSYAFRSRDLRYLDFGIARGHAEYIAQVAVNNMGLSTGFGDATPLTLVPGYQVIAKAAWYYKDERLSWIYQNALPPNTSLRAFQSALPYDLTITPREPVEWTGLSLFPIYKMPPTGRQPLKEPAFAPREPAGPQWFNKVVFREAWDPNAQYLLLDTAGKWIKQGDKVYPPGPAGHKHDDVNTIINFTDEGRMWLVDHTYGVRSIKDHSGLYITRNGKISYRVHEAEVLDHAESDKLAFCTSLYRGFSGTDWKRAIFWLRGEHFVVIDRVTAQEPGMFVARCSFRALGEEELTDSVLRLNQQGKYCHITSDGEATLDVEYYPYDNGDEWRRFYPYTEPVVKIFQQDKSGQLEKGDTISFRNLLHASDSEAELDAVELVPASDNVVLIRNRGTKEDVVVYGMGNPPGGLADTRIFAAAPGRVLLSGLTRLGETGNPLLEASKPVTLFLDEGGEFIIDTSDDVSIQLSGQTEDIQLSEGRYSLEWSEADRAADLISASILMAARDQAISYETAGSAGVAADTSESAVTLDTDTMQLDTSISDMQIADLDGDGNPEWVVAGDKGVTAYRPDGSIMWRYEMEKPGSVLDIGDVDGDGHPEIAAGSQDHKVYLLDADGHKRWEFECKASVNKAGPPVPIFIQMDDLENDGEMEIVVGANWVHCLDAQGQLKWEDYLINARGRISGDFRCGAIADFNGDGQREILALFYYTYHSGMIFGADGKVVHPSDRDRRKKDGMFKLSLPQCVAATNLLGESGTPHFVMGGDSYLQGYWTSGEHAGQPTGRIPGNFVALAIHQSSSGAPIIFGGTDMGAVTAVRAGGKAKGASIPLDTLWTSVLGQKISSLWTGRLNDDRTAVLAGTKAGAAFALDAKTGAVLGGSEPTGSPIVKFMGFKGGILALHRDGVVEKIRMSK